jgi:plastocyanin domain-containing protein
MSKLLKISLISAMIAGAVVFASCGQPKTETVTNSPKPDVVAENPSEPVNVTVSKNGFEPKTIGVKKGRPVKISFVRTDEENCGNEVVFPKQNIKKTLPLGEAVAVELTAEETGEIGFTCGMDMLRGKIIVQ